MVQSRQVSTEPLRCLEFLTKLKELAGASGYVAIVEVCGFNDWLLELLPKFGCIQTALIQPEKKSKVKTDRRDAKALSELLWVNRDRIHNKLSIRGVRQVIFPTKLNAENQRITLVRQQVARQHTRTINQIKHILRRHNLQWQMPTKTFPSKKDKCRHSQHAGRASTLRPMSKNHGRPSKKTSHPKPGKNRQAIHSGGILIRYFQRSIFQELAPKEKAF